MTEESGNDKRKIINKRPLTVKAQSPLNTDLREAKTALPQELLIKRLQRFEM